MGPKKRNEYKTTIDSNKFEFNKIPKDIEKLETQLKKDKLILKSIESPQGKTGSTGYQKNSEQLDDQEQSINIINNTHTQIIDRDKETLIALNEQGNRIKKITNDLHEVEHELSIQEQLNEVLSNNDLKNRLKLVFVVLLLGFADLLILYIKMK
jgi:hypothetical protein